MAPTGPTARSKFPLPEQVRPLLRAYDTAPRSQAKPSFEVLSDRPILKGKRIIVIEDEPLVSMDMESTLAGAGCEPVGAAGTLAAARTLSATVETDAAFLDVNLGGQPVDELAASLTTRGIPFAFVTGYGQRVPA